MGAFKASEAVSGLDFDLSPYGGVGVIPEPSTAQVEALGKALAAISDDDTQDPNAALKHIAKLSEDEQNKILDGIMGALADITGAVLTREQIDALPYRIKNSFIGWLLRSLLLPESSSPATTV